MIITKRQQHDFTWRFCRTARCGCQLHASCRCRCLTGVGCPTILTTKRSVEEVALDSGERLDDFLRKRVPGITPAQVADWIRTGAVRIRGKVCKPLRRIHRGDEVTLQRPAPKRVVEKAPVARPSITLLHESEHVRVIDKPAGLAVEPEVVLVLAAQMGGWNVGGIAAPGRPRDRSFGGFA